MSLSQLFARRCLALAIMMIISCQAGPALATEKPDRAFRVLFIGNSHVLVNNVPEHVRGRLQAEKGRTEVRAIARGGARLISFTINPDVETLLRTMRWDVVVLQEASASFLTMAGRLSFHRAVDWFVRRLPSETRLVLYQTWPWRNGSRYLEKTPFSSADMWRTMQREYARYAGRQDLTIAPVGACWVNVADQSPLYSHDGNHATVAGSSFAAGVISRTIIQGRSAAC
jgi:hypothetical protein